MARSSRPSKKISRRGLFILPTIFTLGNIFCGYLSIISCIKGDLSLAALYIAGAVVLDGLDGKVARWAHAESSFGLQLDSLADVVSFGVAPGVLVYVWALSDLGRMGWLSGFLFVICGAMRLARFNAQAEETDSRYFVGLPIPAAAATLAAVVYSVPKLDASRTTTWAVLLMTAVLAFLMVSHIRYYSFKKVDFTKRRAMTFLVYVVFILWGISLYPELVFLLGTVSYVLSGPARLGFSTFQKMRLKTLVAQETEEEVG